MLDKMFQPVNEQMGIHMEPVSLIKGKVPLGASLYQRRFIPFLGRINAGGTKTPVSPMQHTAVTVWPRLASFCTRNFTNSSFTFWCYHLRCSIGDC
ncbi:hypothetical protein AVEN_48615-1 [Araneus ventricosus]|uniref:Uncharacterized protein n=1 Tax=Araneus ventricosus TaxID=182803 RepID=A0A4Y1ZL63_ARAVE|nr:hypothetical protein AVEN_48615-1 [Araneus ventricosus]